MTRGLVRLEGVSKRFILHHEKTRSFQQSVVNFFHQINGSREEFWALRNVSFEVGPGEALAIIGRNGSGKSTVFKLMTRIFEPTTGRVMIGGAGNLPRVAGQRRRGFESWRPTISGGYSS